MSTQRNLIPPQRDDDDVKRYQKQGFEGEKKSSDGGSVSESTAEVDKGTLESLLDEVYDTNNSTRKKD